MSRASEIGLSRAGAGMCLVSALLVLLVAHGDTGGTIAVVRAGFPAGAAAASARAARTTRLEMGGAADFVLAGHRDLDRIAAAVDGAESSYGTNLAMWRADPLGPQGPMQVSAAAAADVGGGDRFDLGENLALGRAYLARMYHRYGSWADAIAAYNWGPARMDAWISHGRPATQLPAAVERYTGRVLLASAAPGARLLPTPNLPARNFAPHRHGLFHPQARLRRVPPINPHDPVQLLYSQLMQASTGGTR